MAVERQGFGSGRVEIKRRKLLFLLLDEMRNFYTFCLFGWGSGKYFLVKKSWFLQSDAL